MRANESGNRTSGMCRICGSNTTVPFIQKENYRYLRCVECEMVFADVGEDYILSRNRTIYNENLGSCAPDTDPASSPPESRARRKHLTTLDRLERHCGRGRLLELGCGNGDFLLCAQEQGWETEGVEVAEEAAGVARRRGLTVHVGTLEEKRLEEAVFDAVYMNEVLEHIYHPGKLLRETARLLRPGGILFLRTRNPSSWSVRFCGQNWHHFSVDRCGHVSFFSPRTFRVLLPGAGFEVVSIRTWGSSYGDRYPSHQRVRRRFARTVGKLLDPLASRLERGHRIEAVAAKRP